MRQRFAPLRAMTTVPIWPLVLALGALSAMVAASGRPDPVASAQPLPPTLVPTNAPPTAGPDKPLPCGPHVKRTVDKNVVKEGEKLRVRADYDYDCGGSQLKINFMLVVENTGSITGPRYQRLNNVKKGLRDFVNQVDYEGGSRGGLTLYADDNTIRVPLSRPHEAEAKDRLLQQIQLISPEPIAGSAGAGTAIRDSHAQLPSGVTDASVQNVIIYVDAWAPISAGKQPLVKLENACRAALTSGVMMIVVALKDAGYRAYYQGCVSSLDWFFYAPSDPGSEVPGFLDTIAQKLLRSTQAESDEYSDKMSNFVLVDGSSNPREPDQNFGNEYIWAFNTIQSAPNFRTIEYDVMPLEGTGGQITNLSVESLATLKFNGNTSGSIKMPNPQICIYAAGDEDFCKGFAPTPTPDGSSPTSAPPPATSPPPPPPTNTPEVIPPSSTPPPVNTDVPPTNAPPPTDHIMRWTVFIPYSLRE